MVDLPQGATPLDFAYHVHTEVGHRCRGAKVDGRIVPLDHVLRTAATASRSWSRKPVNRGATGWWHRTASWPAPVRAKRCATGSTSWIARATCRPAASCSTRSSSAWACTMPTWRRRWRSSTRRRWRTCRSWSRSATSARTRSARALLEHERARNRARARRAATGRPCAGTRARDQGRRNSPSSASATCSCRSRAAASRCRARRSSDTSPAAAASACIAQDCATLQRLSATQPQRVMPVEWGRQASGSDADVLVEAVDRKWLLKDVTNLIAQEDTHVLDIHSEPARGGRARAPAAARAGGRLRPAVAPARQARWPAGCRACQSWLSRRACAGRCVHEHRSANAATRAGRRCARHRTMVCRVPGSVGPWPASRSCCCCWWCSAVRCRIASGPKPVHRACATARPARWRTANLTAADGSGARELYEAALAIDPDANDARTGLMRVAQAALSQATSAIDRGRLRRRASGTAARARAVGAASAGGWRGGAIAPGRSPACGHRPLVGSRRRVARRAHRLDGVAGCGLAHLPARAGHAARSRRGARGSRGCAVGPPAESARRPCNAAISPKARDWCPWRRPTTPATPSCPMRGRVCRSRWIEANARARGALRQGSLAQATEQWRAVLQVDAGNRDATDGLERVASAWARRAERDAADFRFDQAAARIGAGACAWPGRRGRARRRARHRACAAVAVDAEAARSQSPACAGRAATA